MKTRIIHLPKKGRALIADEEIAKGQVVEKCELLFMKIMEIPHSIEPFVYEYDHRTVAIALGNGSLINHSDNPNCEF